MEGTVPRNTFCRGTAAGLDSFIDALGLTLSWTYFDDALSTNHCPHRLDSLGLGDRVILAQQQSRARFLSDARDVRFWHGCGYQFSGSGLFPVLVL